MYKYRICCLHCGKMKDVETHLKTKRKFCDKECSDAFKREIRRAKEHFEPGVAIDRW